MNLKFFSCLALAVWSVALLPSYGVAKESLLWFYTEAEIGKEAEPSMVRVGWVFKNAPPLDLIGFNLKRKNLGEGSDWVQLNKEVLEPRSDGLINWSDRGLTEGQKEEIQNALQNLKSGSSVKRLNVQGIVDEYKYATDNSYSLLSQFFAENFNHYFLFGCGYIDNQVDSNEDYLYGIFLVTESGGEASEPEATSVTNWLDFSDSGLSQDLISNVAELYDPEKTNRLKLQISLNEQVAEDLQICYLQMRKGDPEKPIQCRGAVIVPGRLKKSLKRNLYDYKFSVQESTIYRLHPISCLGTRLPIIEYQVDGADVQHKVQQKLDQEAKAKEAKVQR